MKDVYYVGFYDVPQEGDVKRNIHLAGTNKMTYIISALERCDKNVNVISMSQTLESAICKSTTKRISDKSNLFLPFCFGRGGKIKRLMDYFGIRIQLLYLLVFGVKKHSEVIVYHSLAYMKTIQFAKLLRKFCLTLEIEEIYGDVLRNEKTVKKEIKFFRKADKYIFPSKLLNEKVNVNKKPYVTVHGTYKPEEDYKKSFNDDKIHIVYAGTFDPRKGGALAAISATEFLPEEYYMHIIGFGGKDDTDNIEKLITQTNQKSMATVTFDGKLIGSEYNEFLQKCHIGLSTQNPDADFNATSFPSKILSYMANGLRVVSINIPAVKESDISEDIYYYDIQEPETIAKAIMHINLSDGYDGRKKLCDLDKKFVEELKKIME